MNRTPRHQARRPGPVAGVLGALFTRPVLLGCLLLPSGAQAQGQDGSPEPAAVRLSALRVTGAGALTPDFTPTVFHYALRCKERQTLAVSATAGGDARLWLNGRPVSGAVADAPVHLADDEDLLLELEAPGAKDRLAYVVHCVPAEFPDVKILRKEPGTAAGLLLVTPYYNRPGADGPVAYLAMLDDNGVPRFTRRVSPGAHNFRWHAHARRYSYAETRPNAAGDVVLLDERLAETGRVGTVGGLAPAMMHEFLVTDEGTYLFVSNNPVTRDLSRYPGREGQPAPSSAEPTRDAVIQEVSPDGREIFRWHAWDHLKLSDCLWREFPREYAKLNGLSLVEGDIVASFRACSQVLKIERPSGRVLWQVGGSDPARPDPYDARRPVFDRPWYRPAGDPREGFCAQHTPVEIEPGRLLLFDNGQCVAGDRPSSRVVEYRLDPGGAAAFVRHHEPGRVAVYGGAVARLDNGNWLISWGGGPGNVTVSEVDSSGRELLALQLFKGADVAMTYRAYRHTGPEPPWRRPRAEPAAGIDDRRR